MSQQQHCKASINQLQICRLYTWIQHTATGIQFSGTFLGPLQSQQQHCKASINRLQICRLYTWIQHTANRNRDTANSNNKHNTLQPNCLTKTLNQSACQQGNFSELFDKNTNRGQGQGANRGQGQWAEQQVFSGETNRY
jgi:hypothetical protein